MPLAYVSKAACTLRRRWLCPLSLSLRSASPCGASAVRHCVVCGCHGTVSASALSGSSAMAWQSVSLSLSLMEQEITPKRMGPTKDAMGQFGWYGSNNHTGHLCT